MAYPISVLARFFRPGLFVLMLTIMSCSGGTYEVDFRINSLETIASDTKPEMTDADKVVRVNEGDTLIIIDNSSPISKIKKRTWSTGPFQYIPRKDDESVIEVVCNKPNVFFNVALCVNDKEDRCVKKWVFVKEKFDENYVEPIIIEPRVKTGGSKPPRPPKNPGITPPSRQQLVKYAPQLVLDGDWATLTGIVDGEYQVTFKVNGQENNEIVKFSSTKGRWKLRLDDRKQNKVELTELIRMSDMEMAALNVSSEFGEDNSLRGQQFEAGFKFPAKSDDCDLRWLQTGEMTFTPQGTARLEYGYIFLENKGKVQITMRVGDEERKITRLLNKGKNQVALQDLIPEAKKGETLTLIIKPIDNKMADLTSCGGADHKGVPATITYKGNAAFIGDIKVRFL
ncbi:MAG: hypothetical protein KA479_11660 [Saprospiraceae bacterium]|nr:hypothetical protein [Saprospiraceae bacterium]